MTAESVVLEIGCGTGEFTQRIAPGVRQLWATDLSPELLDRARQRLAAVAPQATVVFQVADAMASGLPADKFDAVFGCSVLHHLDPARALVEAWRVLKPGGWCVFSEPNMLNPQIALQKNVPFIKRRLGDSPEETAFFYGRMHRGLTAAGFINVRVRHFDFLHPRTPPGWIRRVEQLGQFLENCWGVRAISGSLLACGQKPPASS